MTAAFGWRARIALILPADNVVMEPELADLDIPGVSFHGLRLTAIDVVGMRAQAVELSSALSEMGVDMVVYACAETSFNGGDSARRTLSELVADRSGLPVVTATDAMLEGARALGIRRPAVVTPYSERSGALFESTLGTAGLEVQSARHHDFSADGDDPREWFYTNRQPITTVLELAAEVDVPSADSLVLAATNIPVIGAIRTLEERTGKPVVTSNQSILWWCLNRLGIDAPDLPLGRLLRASGARVGT